MADYFPNMMKNVDPQITAKLLKTKDKDDCKWPDKISITYKTMILTANFSEQWKPEDSRQYLHSAKNQKIRKPKVSS